MKIPFTNIEIRNTIPQNKKGMQITNNYNNNNNSPDPGVGGYGVTLQTGTTTQPKDLEDLILVDKTVANARRAVELDPTTWSSLLSLVIASTKDQIEITADEDANPKAVKHITNKVRDWGLDQLKIITAWKGLIDGRCFIETYIQPGIPSIQEVNHLAFDEDHYNFIEVVDPYTNQLLGYKQKAKIYPVPSNWEAMSFDMLKNRTHTIKETTFTRTNGYLPVFMPRFFQGDGNSEGLVFKVLDDVYILKGLKNLMLDAAKMASVTTAVQVGNKDFPFEPYDDADTTDVKIRKSEERMQDIGSNFSEKFKKQVILHDGSVTAYMLGTGQLANIPLYNDFFKQEIRSGLLTPDSRFESASSNRAVSQEQMTGSMGQVTVVDYIQNNYINYHYEKYIIDLELTLNNFTDDVGKIHISYGEKETENEVDLSQIGNSILQFRPDLFDMVITEYYPRIAEQYAKSDKKGAMVQVVEEPVTNSIPRGFKDVTDLKAMAYVEATKTRLIEEGLLI